MTEVAGYLSNFDPDGNVRLFLAPTRDSRQWPSSAPPSFLNIQLECGEVAAVCVRAFACASMSVYESLSEREEERDYRGAANTGIMIPLI